MNIRRRINLYRRYPYWKKQECIYIHIPKVAGTSINHALYGRTLGHYSAMEIREKFPQLYANCFTFSFVRNPWERTLSAYRFAKKGGTETMGVNNPMQHQIPEFDSFESFIHEWLANKKLSSLDYIFRPQSNFIYDQNDILIIDYLGRLENLDSDIREINKLTKKSISVPRLNFTAAENNYRDYYNTNMLDLVAQIYKRDVQLFNYEY